MSTGRKYDRIACQRARTRYIPAAHDFVPAAGLSQRSAASRASHRWHQTARERSAACSQVGVLRSCCARPRAPRLKFPEAVAAPIRICRHRVCSRYKEPGNQDSMDKDSLVADVGFISPPNLPSSPTCRAVRSHRRRHHRSAKVICTTPHGAGDIRAQFASGVMLLCTPVLRAVWRVQAASARASRMRTTTSTEVRGVRRRCVPVRVLLLRVPPTCARGCSAWRTRARAHVGRFLSRPCFALCADVCSEPMLRAPAVAGRVCAAHQ